MLSGHVQRWPNPSAPDKDAAAGPAVNSKMDSWLPMPLGYPAGGLGPGELPNCGAALSGGVQPI